MHRRGGGEGRASRLSRMKLEDGIRKHGFRRWYSRELTQAHLQLLLFLFCAIGLFAGLELLSRPLSWSERWGNAVLVLICLGVGLWSLRRYLFLMMRAEGIAAQAVCPHCQAYGLLRIADRASGSEPVPVSCRKCATTWQISDLASDDG